MTNNVTGGISVSWSEPTCFASLAQLVESHPHFQPMDAHASSYYIAGLLGAEPQPSRDLYLDIN